MEQKRGIVDNIIIMRTFFPRCLIMIAPGFACVPGQTLIPSYGQKIVMNQMVIRTISKEQKKCCKEIVGTP